MRHIWIETSTGTTCLSCEIIGYYSSYLLIQPFQLFMFRSVCYVYIIIFHLMMAMLSNFVGYFSVDQVR